MRIRFLVPFLCFLLFAAVAASQTLFYAKTDTLHEWSFTAAGQSTTFETHECKSVKAAVTDSTASAVARFYSCDESATPSSECRTLASITGAASPPLVSIGDNTESFIRVEATTSPVSGTVDVDVTCRREGWIESTDLTAALEAAGVIAVFPDPSPYPTANFYTVEYVGGDYAALEFPPVYASTMTPVSTAGWTTYDVSCECNDGDCEDPRDYDNQACTPAGGGVALPSGWGCGALDGSGTADNGPAFDCIQDNAGNHWLSYFPDGVYDFASTNGSNEGKIWFIDPATDDNQGIQCESIGAVINVKSGMQAENQSLRFMALNNDSELGTPVVWTTASGSRVKGETDFTSATPLGLSEGDWVQLKADPTAVQDATDRLWHTTIASIDGTSFSVTHPLPEDFGGANPEVTPWNAAENILVRDCRLQYENADHDPPVFMFGRGIAKFELSGNVFTNHYSDAVIFGAPMADAYVFGNSLVNNRKDKGPNNYNMRYGGVSRGWIHDNHFEATTGLALQGGVQNAIVTFNDFRGPSTPAGVFDEGCDQVQPSGDTNGCLVVHDVTGENSHDPTYLGATAISECTAEFEPYECCTGAGAGTCVDVYTHCSSRYEDLSGENGDAACRGNPASYIYSSFEMHNESPSSSLISRNYAEGPFWYDDTFGPGRGNFFHGNWFHDESVSGALTDSVSPGGSGAMGSFSFRGGFESLPAGYKNDNVWTANVIEGTFGLGGFGFDPYGENQIIMDMVIEDGCVYQGVGSSAATATGGDCVVSDDSSLPDSTGLTWTNNEVGADVHSSARLVPSVPGFSEWPDFYIDTDPLYAEFPFVGPERGDPDLITPCLPAWRRYNGSC